MLLSLAMCECIWGAWRTLIFNQTANETKANYAEQIDSKESIDAIAQECWKLLTLSALSRKVLGGTFFFN